jgi:cytochrome c oxidase cbb3-type subunit III
VFSETGNSNFVSVAMAICTGATYIFYIFCWIAFLYKYQIAKANICSGRGTTTSGGREAMSDNTFTENSEVLKGEESLLLDHNYDGIRELDHVLPRWWLWTLYCTIVFAIFYSAYYLSGVGQSSQQELNLAMKEIEALNPAPAVGTSGDSSDLLAALKNPERLKSGAEVYAGKCFACHGDKGQGIVGPNLTDDYWIHGSGNLQDIAAVVSNGVLDKGMPPWGPSLTPEELSNVVAFVYSLHGTHPGNPKAPQGQKQEDND